MYYELSTSIEFEEWFANETRKSRLQIASRLERIVKENHFGDYKHIADEIYELRWENGRRLYYFHLKSNRIVILIGGNKNGQKKDIRRAKKIIEKNRH